MNAENILKVADAIEQRSIPGLGFNLGNYVGPTDGVHPDLSGNNCGTIACVAGWSYAVRRGSIVPEHISSMEFDWKAEGDWLGLDEGDAEQLFHNYGDNRTVGPKQAVRTLRHLATTGEVDWTV